MAEHGILMRDEMVRALLREPGDPLRKTVTRRTSDQWASRKVGDLLWVKECFAPTNPANPRVRVSYRADGQSYGLNGGWASGDGGGLMFPETLGIKIPFPKRWTPSVLMPRWASRLTLRIVDLRRERGTPYTSIDGLLPFGLWRSDDSTDDPPHRYASLPWVDDAEARREGVEDRAKYCALWEAINGPVYPEWLWRIEFEEVQRG